MTTIDLPSPAVDTDAVKERLDAVRQRTLDLVSTLGWKTLRRQHIAILSPMVWDLGHIGNFEETWIGQRLGGHAPLVPYYQQMFDPGQNPRPSRDQLPLPERDDLLAYLAQVRARSLAVLAQARDEPLTRNGYVFELVAEHEEQHQETLLQCMQVLDSPPYTPPAQRPLPVGREVDGATVEIPAGPFLMGWPTTDSRFAYDNEKIGHEVELEAFRIDRFPVTNGDYLAFVEAEGYQRRELWSAAGWAWRQSAGETVQAPRNWLRIDRQWHVRYMQQVLPLPAERPVVHVCYYEAEAYARFAGKRLPSEAEWEKAALWDPESERSRLYPWGDTPYAPGLANLDQLAFAPAPVGAFPGGASAYGVEHLLGDVWEWTASDFTAYPGFIAYPYDEYSKIFFGSDYKVLRGGSWATRPAVARGTFRNWDFPIRRQIFAGIRCACDPS